MPRRVGCNLFQFIVLPLFLQACQALTLFPPPPPVFLGTTVQVTWTFTSADPASFYLFAQCSGTPSTPRLNVTTADGQVFVILPSGFDFDIALPCVVQGRMHSTDQLLSSAPFSLILKDASAAPRPPPTDSPGSAIPTPQEADNTFILTTPDATTPGVTRSVTSVRSADAISMISPSFGVPLTSFTQPATISSWLSSGPTSIPTSTPTLASTSTSTYTSQYQVQTGELPANDRPKKIPIGIIVGGSIGAVVLLALLLAYFVVYRQRRRSMLIPFAYGETYSQISGRVPETIPAATREKAVIRSQQYHPHNIALDPQSSRSASTSNVSGRPPSTTIEEIATDPRLRHMVLTMSERIMALEAQRRDLAVQEGGWGYEEDLHQQPPPEYSRNPNYRPLPPTPMSTILLRRSESHDAVPETATPKHS